jgi:hypothetical protein
MSRATSYATNSTLSIQAHGETDEDQLWAREWVRERVERALRLQSSEPMVGAVHPENGSDPTVSRDCPV